MTGAAAVLGLTQSAVSQIVRRIELDFGVPLVERGRRPLVLTQAGELLHMRATALVRDADSIPRSLRTTQNKPVRELRLGFVDTFASTAGPELIRNLTNTATRVVLWSGLSPSLGTALLNREVDAIVTSDPLEDADGLRRFPLWREPFVVLIPATANKRLMRADISLLATELAMVRYSERSHTGIQIERHLRRIGIVPERRIEVDGSDALVAMVAAGVGWALTTPLCLLQGAAHLGTTQIVPVNKHRFNRTLYLVCHANGPADIFEGLAGEAKEILRRVFLPRVSQLSSSIIDQISTEFE